PNQHRDQPCPLAIQLEKLATDVVDLNVRAVARDRSQVVRLVAIALVPHADSIHRYALVLQDVDHRQRHLLGVVVQAERQSARSTRPAGGAKDAFESRGDPIFLDGNLADDARADAGVGHSVLDLYEQAIAETVDRGIEHFARIRRLEIVAASHNDVGARLAANPKQRRRVRPPPTRATSTVERPPPSREPPTSAHATSLLRP